MKYFVPGRDGRGGQGRSNASDRREASHGDAAAHGRLGGLWSHELSLEKEVCFMTGRERDNRQDESRAHSVRLPGFVTDEDIGLGDVVKRMTHAVGIRPCRG